MLCSVDCSRAGPPDACGEIGETRNTTDLGKRLVFVLRQKYLSKLPISQGIKSGQELIECSTDFCSVCSSIYVTVSDTWGVLTPGVVPNPTFFALFTKNSQACVDKGTDSDW